jgi:hypothetical protein
MKLGGCRPQTPSASGASSPTLSMVVGVFGHPGLLLRARASDSFESHGPRGRHRPVGEVPEGSGRGGSAGGSGRWTRCAQEDRDRVRAGARPGSGTCSFSNRTRSGSTVPTASGGSARCWPTATPSARAPPWSAINRLAVLSLGRVAEARCCWPTNVIQLRLGLRPGHQPERAVGGSGHVLGRCLWWFSRWPMTSAMRTGR